MRIELLIINANTKIVHQKKTEEKKEIFLEARRRQEKQGRNCFYDIQFPQFINRGKK